ncbi:23019_t:CDS:1, partial [Gigaspora margarita]
DKINKDISLINKWQDTVNKWTSYEKEKEVAVLDNYHSATAFDDKWKLETLFDKNSFKLPVYLNLLLTK